MEAKWTPNSTKSLPFLWKSGLHCLFAHMFPALQMFSHLLVKFASVFGRPNPWKPWFFLRKTTILKKPLFFKRWPKRTQNHLKIWRKLPPNAPENTKKADKCCFWGGPKTYWKKKTEKSSKIGPKEGQKPLGPDLAGERKAQFGIFCENFDSCCHLWNLLFCVGLYCYLQRFAAIWCYLLLFATTCCC